MHFGEKGHKFFTIIFFRMSHVLLGYKYFTAVNYYHATAIVSRVLSLVILGVLDVMGVSVNW